DGSEPLTNRRTDRSPSASERPEHVAQVRTRRTAAPDQPAADPSSIRSPAPTRRNESAITVGFNTAFFNTIGAKPPLVAWDEGQGFLFAVVPAFQPVLAKRRPRNLNVMRAS